MKPFLILTCFGLMISTTVWAEDTTAEPCANGAGTFVEGAITGYKYCKSNNAMNWWNAYAWCDALGMKLFDVNNCKCSGTTNCRGICPELIGVGDSQRYWTTTPFSEDRSYNVDLSTGHICAEVSACNYGSRYSQYFALCK